MTSNPAAADPVVVAGGGPAGLLLAGELALAGVPAVVIERRDSVGTRSNGMAIHGRSLASLHLRGLAESIRDQAFGWPRTPFSLLWLNLDAAGDEDWTFGFPQWYTEELLAQWATGLGAQLRRGEEVIGYAADETGVTVSVRRAGAEEYQIRASYLVGCDGPDSLIRQQAGIGLTGNGPSYYGILGDVTPIGEPAFDAGPRPHGMFGALPIEPGKIRLMCIEFERPAPAGEPTLDELVASVERLNGEPPAIKEAHWLSRFGGPTRLAERYREGRVLLAGDAAHQLFVSGTQGLNAALQDAMNLGWKLAAEVNGWAPPGLLDSYQTERHPVGQRICRHAAAAMALMHPLERITPLREVFAELIGYDDVSRHLLRMPAEDRYPIEYPGRPASQAHPLVGTQIADAPLRTPAGDTSVAATLHAGRGVLLDLTAGAAAGADLSGRADRVQSVQAEPIPEIEATVVLVRPDGYVAFADPTGADASGLEQALATWFGEPGR